ncbi:MAG: DUF2461 domain-containing protein [Saprospiraceae bacterium]|nr:DUF2461 domain-containing protein [Saprospiraceae bacterium]
MTTIETSTLAFLRDLAANNYKEWFTGNKDRYEAAKANVEAFRDSLWHAMNQVDVLEGIKIFRIYRDVRFSKDKSPYKNYFGLSMNRATAQRRGGYYFHLEPGATFAGGGFFGPNTEDVRRIRQAFSEDDRPIRQVTADPEFKSYFGQLAGEELKNAPRGFSNDDPAIDLIRKKSWIVRRPFRDDEVSQPGFPVELVKTYVAMLPYFNYMTKILTE